MKYREIFKKVLKCYKEIANKYLGGEIEYYKIPLMYEIIEEINGQGIEMSDKQEEMLCDYVYNVYMRYDGTNINIYNIVHTIYLCINSNMTVNEILSIDIDDFCNHIII